MAGLYFEFPCSVTALCHEEDLSYCLANAWDIGACGEDWVWSWSDSDHVRISFKREEDSLAFISRASVWGH
jgi:hypothetical protein